MEVIEINAAPEEGDNPFDELHSQGETAQEGGLVAYDSASDDNAGLSGQDLEEGQVAEAIQEADGHQDANMIPEVKESPAVLPVWFTALTDAQQQEVSAFIRYVSVCYINALQFPFVSRF
jgi:hypothetical protein